MMEAVVSRRLGIHSVAEQVPTCRVPAARRGGVQGVGQRCHGARSVPCLVHRYYDPETGGFSSVDPLVATTTQPYVYANDDPVNGEDPAGLSNWWQPGLWGQIEGLWTSSTPVSPSTVTAPSEIDRQVFTQLTESGALSNWSGQPKFADEAFVDGGTAAIDEANYNTKCGPGCVWVYGPVLQLSQMHLANIHKRKFSWEASTYYGVTSGPKQRTVSSGQPLKQRS